MSSGEAYAPPISEGRPGAPIGSREWADWVRTLMLTKIERLGQQDEDLVQYIDLLKKHRAWTLMNKPDGSFFMSIEEFCEHRRPYGLGTPWPKLRPFLVAGLAKAGKSPDDIERTLQLEEVPQAKPAEQSLSIARAARTKKNLESLSGRDGPSDDTSQNGLSGRDGPSEEMPSRVANRLRAITRAPDPVKDAYREGRISQTLAAKLGPKNPDPDTAAQIASIAQEIRKEPDRKKVDALVRERLGAPAPTAVDRAVKAVERLTTEQRNEFFKRLESLRGNAPLER